MSDPIGRHPYFSKQRQCLRCKAGISQTRPVFLVADRGGQILGPFHAGCAEALKLEVKRLGMAPGATRTNTFGTWPSIREETLPE